jgi:hypothetical protein
MTKDTDRYLTIHCWLVQRYQRTDRNGRKWLDQYRGGKPTKYKRLERAFFNRYMMRWMAAR